MTATTDAVAARSFVKCVVWDLDGTVWDGTLLEDAQVRLVDGVRLTLDALDSRGILNSIASRNEHSHALGALEEAGIAEYFLVPQINWGSKAASIRVIGDELNIGLDSIAFVDDQQFDREEVGFSLPEVRCYCPSHIPSLLERPEFNPPVTAEASGRRLLYQADERRKQAGQDFDGSPEEFLASLDMAFTIRTAKAGDLDRAEELTVRTNQLNTTGRAYSKEELAARMGSPAHEVLVAELVDRFGGYGIVGLALIDVADSSWTLKLFLMSCRVMSRGVGSVFLAEIARRAEDAGVRLLAEVIPNGRNRIMVVTLGLSGFEHVEARPDLVMLESRDAPPGPPSYLTLVTDRERTARSRL